MWGGRIRHRRESQSRRRRTAPLGSRQRPILCNFRSDGKQSHNPSAGEIMMDKVTELTLNINPSSLITKRFAEGGGSENFVSLRVIYWVDLLVRSKK